MASRAYDPGYPSTGSSYRTQRTFDTSPQPPRRRDGMSAPILDPFVSAGRVAGRRPQTQSRGTREPIVTASALDRQPRSTIAPQRSSMRQAFQRMTEKAQVAMKRATTT